MNRWATPKGKLKEQKRSKIVPPRISNGNTLDTYLVKDMQGKEEDEKEGGAAQRNWRGEVAWIGGKGKEEEKSCLSLAQGYLHKDASQGVLVSSWTAC